MSTMATSTRLWPRFEEVLRRQRLMERMMQTSGVDVPMAIRVDGGLAFIEARGKCRYCLHEESLPSLAGTRAISHKRFPISVRTQDFLPRVTGKTNRRQPERTVGCSEHG